MSSHALKIGIRLGTLCDAAQAEENEMKRQAVCSHGMPTRLPHCGGRSMDLRQPGGQQLRDTRSDPCPQMRLYAKASEPRMEQK
jgi:hypothetical protein